ncbi:MAG: GNAT family N-acetyltransferase, partial [Thermoleophilia bacterium]|nr:GNAT family N-acetyltransferase [Thermoleophilia bacterium]
MTRELLQQIAEYCDAAPRAVTEVETVGGFELFIGPRDGWQFAARPALNGTGWTVTDVGRALSRQLQLDMALQFAWVEEHSPGLADVMAAAGLELQRFPLLVLSPEVDVVSPVLPEHAESNGATDVARGEVRAAVTDDEIAAFASVGVVAFTFGGTERGEEGIDELREATGMRMSALIDFERGLLEAGGTVRLAAFADQDPVSTGVVQRIGAVAELTGIGTLPAFRREGHGRRVTQKLVAAGRELGAATLFLTVYGDELERT